VRLLTRCDAKPPAAARTRVLLVPIRDIVRQRPAQAAARGGLEPLLARDGRRPAKNSDPLDRRWKILQVIPARVRFISYVPALEPLTVVGSPRPDWIICGGQSGQKAIKMDEQWARDIRDICATAGVAFFMKQMTNKASIPDDLMVRQFPAKDRPTENALLPDLFDPQGARWQRLQ
jgi:hypothetical protein